MGFFRVLFLVGVGVQFSSCTTKVITRPPGVDHIHGTWTFEPPALTPSGSGNYSYGQYLYVSPMGATCTRNLTIHVGGTTLWACQVGHVSQAYLDSHECIPDALMMPAYIVDVLNRKNVIDIPGTCIQLSAAHYNYGTASQETFTKDIIESTRKEPRKHGIATSAHGDKTYFMATAAKMVGLPLIDGNWMGADSIRHSDTSEFPTLFRTLSDRRWFLQQYLQLLPDSFALLTDDAAGSGAQTAIIKQAVMDAGKAILHHGIVPAMVGNYERTAHGVDAFLTEVRRKGIRYTLLAAGPSVQPVLACQIHRLQIPTQLIQVVALGAASSGEPSAWMAAPYCNIQEIMAVCENSGWIGVQACTASTYVEDDLVVNQVTGGGLPESISQGLDGSPWTMNKTLQVLPMARCQDAKDAVNSSMLLRRLVNKGTGETLTCKDLEVFAQSVRYAYITLIAELCPITSCAYNMYSYACRISCACQDTALQTTDGKPLCTSFDQLPRGYNVALPYQIAEYRCSGQGCRELPYFPSAFAFWNMGLEYTFERPNDWENVPADWDGGVPVAGMVYTGVAGFCRARKYGDCGYLGRGSPSKYIGMTLSDALWAYALAYKCIYNRFGDEGLDSLAHFDYLDPAVTAAQVECLTNEVEFEGTHGRVNFKFHRSPSPGYSINTVNQPAYSTKRGVMTCGHVRPSGPVISSKVFTRDDYRMCPAGIGDFAPIRNCPAGTSIEQVVNDTQESLMAKIPLGIPQLCPPGQYPLAEGESTIDKIDRCVPCKIGTFKQTNGSDRCSPCAAGEFSAEFGSTKCERCPDGTYSPEAVEQDINPWTSQSSGYSSCTECAAGRASSLSSEIRSSCSVCSSGSFASSAGQSECEFCPRGTYAPEPGTVNCTGCPPSKTTENIASEYISACRCGPNSPLRRNSTDTCLPCPTGLVCDWLTDNEVVTEKPYMVFEVSKAEADYDVFLCQNEEACSGNSPPYTCGNNFDGYSKACAECKQGFFPSKEQCKPCADAGGDGMKTFGLILIGLAAATGIIALYYMGNNERTSEGTASLVFAISIGMELKACQLFATLSLYELNTPPFLRSFLESFTFFLFYFEVVGVDCVYRRTALEKYVVRTMIPACLGIFVIVCFAVSRLLKDRPGFLGTLAWTWPKTCNMIGFLLQLLLVTNVVVAVEPLRCYTHPDRDDSDPDRASLQGYPSVMCNSNEWAAMVPFSVYIFIAFVLGFLAVSLYGIWKAPTNSTESFQTSFAFLFGDFRPEYWWFGLVFLWRSMMIAMAPAMAPTSAVAQVCILQGTVVICFGLSAALQPWVLPLLNHLDVVTSGIFVCLIASLPFLDSSDEAGTSNASVVWITVLAVVNLAAVGLVAGVSFANILRRQPMPTAKSPKQEKSMADSWWHVSENIVLKSQEDLFSILETMPVHDVNILKHHMTYLIKETGLGQLQLKEENGAPQTWMTIRRSTSSLECGEKQEMLRAEGESVLNQSEMPTNPRTEEKQPNSQPQSQDPGILISV